MENNQNKIKQIARELFDCKAICFGEFTLKSGIISPIYIDLRVIISYPKLLQNISELFFTKIKSLDFNCICGVPYTALPIACAISLNHHIPMLIRRKEAKNYGTKKIIEGVFKKKDKCLIIEDLITSGKSILETREALENEGLIVKDAIVLIDRNQGGDVNLERNQIKLHSIFKIDDFLTELKKQNKITSQQYQTSLAFIKTHQVSL